MGTYKHIEIVEAKLNNMELVVFEKDITGEYGELVVDGNKAIWFHEDFDYFICLPKHREAVLNLLNGGESETKTIHRGWMSTELNGYWKSNQWYMSSGFESRIKPRKQERWIIITGMGYEYYSKTEPNAIPDGSTIHKIELEI